MYDYGLSVEHAVRLAKDNELRYFTPYVKAMSDCQFEDYAPGLGMEGITKSEDFFEDVDWADLIMFCDVGAGDLCDFLKRKGYLVYGAGFRGENLENKRWETRQLQKQIGLPTQRTIYLKDGIKQVREFLKSDKSKNGKGWFIKLDKFRGDIESFYAKDFESVETILDNIEVALGPFKDAYPFMAEEKLDGMEPGFDLFFNGKEFLKPYLWGYEYAKACYIGVYCDELPRPLRLVAEKLTPILRKYDYHGAISVETIVDDKGRPFLIDVTARFPFPLSSLYTEVIENYSEVIEGIARGNSVEIKTKHKYVGAFPLETPFAKEHWTKLNFDKKYKENIKLRIGVAVNGNYYGVRGYPEVATIVAGGQTVQEVIDQIVNLADKVDAHQLCKDTGGLNKIMELIRKGQKVGLTFK